MLLHDAVNWPPNRQNYLVDDVVPMIKWSLIEKILYKLDDKMTNLRNIIDKVEYFHTCSNYSLITHVRSYVVFCNWIKEYK